MSFSAVLAIGGIGTPIFIHPISPSIQASSIIAELAGRTIDSLRDMERLKTRLALAREAL